MTAVGKLVFLLVVAAIPNAMLCMTTTAGMVQKAAFGRSKSPPLAVKKQLIVGPSLTLTKGWKFILVVFEEVVVHTFPLGKVGMGLPYRVARGAHRPQWVTLHGCWGAHHQQRTNHA